MQKKQYQYGGTCYTLNANLMRLLQQLGFDCHHVMLGGEHMAIIVVIEGERFYVDCGAAAPFFRPVKLAGDETDVTSFEDDHITLKLIDPVEEQYSYIRVTQGKKSTNVWTFHPSRQHYVEDFIPVMQQSFTQEAPFMTILRCQKWQTNQGRSLSLRNNHFSVRYANGEVMNRLLISAEEIEEVLAEEFHLPKLPVAKAMRILEKNGMNIFAEYCT